MGVVITSGEQTKEKWVDTNQITNYWLKLIASKQNYLINKINAVNAEEEFMYYIFILPRSNVILMMFQLFSLKHANRPPQKYASTRIQIHTETYPYCLNMKNKSWMGKG